MNSTAPTRFHQPSPTLQWWRKEENIATIIFLILFPIIGLILLWGIGTWSRKVKIIITATYVIPIIFIAFLYTVVIGPGARDSVRRVDMHKIFFDQQSYYRANNIYYISAEAPIDPAGKIPYGSYGWVDNTGNNQEFCAYANLERGSFFVASHKGTGEITKEPTTLSDCETQNISIPDLDLLLQDVRSYLEQ